MKIRPIFLYDRIARLIRRIHCFLGLAVVLVPAPVRSSNTQSTQITLTGAGAIWTTTGNYAVSGVLPAGNHHLVVSINHFYSTEFGPSGEFRNLVSARLELAAPPSTAGTASFSRSQNVQGRIVGLDAYIDSFRGPLSEDGVFGQKPTEYAARLEVSRAIATPTTIGSVTAISGIKTTYQELPAGSVVADIVLVSRSKSDSTYVFYPTRSLATAQTYVGWQFSLPAPTAFTLAGTISEPPLGIDQTFPILPDGVTPGGDFTFFGGTGHWYDPPIAFGYRYSMAGSSKFTAIADFPVGISSSPFTVSVAGQKLGDFNPGERCDFTAVLGAPVSSFVVSGIVPYRDAESPTAFPIKLDFDTPTANFTMKPLLVPESTLTRAAAGQVEFSWSTEPELRYQVQWSPNLVDWNDDGTLLQGTGGVMSVLRTLSTDPKRFLRAQIK